MSKRILIISRPDLLPAVHGAAVKIVRTAESLSRLGAEVTVATNDRLWFYEAKDGILQRKRYPQALISLTRVPPVLKARLEALGIPSYWHGLDALLRTLGYPKDERFLYQPLVDPDFWLRILYLGFTHRIEVYQAEFPGYAMPALIASRLLGGQSALVEHNVEHKRLRDTTGLPTDALERIRALESFCIRSVDHLIAVSEVDRALLLEDGARPERTVVIPHGVDLPAYQELKADGVRAHYRIPPDIPLLVFHGTLHYWPNTVAVRHLAERILPSLARRGLQVKALVIGMNPPTYYAHPDLIFTDVVQDLPQHLKAAELAVVPLEDGGGTRLKILEYFAAGVPVVSTLKGAEGIPAVDGVEIALEPSVDRLVERVAHLLTHRDEARRLGRAGQAFVQRYDWDLLCQQYLSLYGGSVLAAGVGARAAGGGNPGASGQLATEGQAPVSPSVIRTGGSRAGGPVSRPSSLPEAMARVSAHLEGPWSPTKPLTLIMLINRGCNLRCAFCDLYEHPRYMPEAQGLSIITQAAVLGVKTLVLTGGEPFLHPRLWTLIGEARRLGVGTNITTNGTLIEKHLDALLASGVSSISVSLDGLEATHEALRKVSGCHSATLRGLRLLRQHGIPTSIYFVITGQNIHELVPVYELAQSLGCRFDFWPVNDAHGLYLVTPEHRAAYLEALETLAARDGEVASRFDYYRAGLDYHGGWDKRVRCLGLIEQAGVNLEGELVPCCVWDNRDLAVGSLVDQDLQTLWYGEEARRRREQIYSAGCHNRCFNHSLYEFQRATGQSFVVGEGQV